jgi:hypothetical protein
MADDDYGLPAAIAECSYNMSEPATRYQPWVAEVLQQYTAFGSFVTASKVPADVQHKVRWTAAAACWGFPGPALRLFGAKKATRYKESYHCALALARTHAAFVSSRRLSL